MNTKFTYRHQYDEVRDKREAAHSETVNEEPSMTQQHYTDEVNLNTIVQRFGIGDGAIVQPPFDPKLYGDFTEAIDFREALDIVRSAEKAFNALPADLRNKFENDPARLWKWIHDENNHEEAIALGLLKKTGNQSSDAASNAASSAGTTPIAATTGAPTEAPKN